MRKKRSSHGTPPRGGGVEALVRIEWEVIEKLRKLAEEAEEEKYRVQYYLNLSSHARTLAYLINQSGGVDSAQDLARLLRQIGKQARRLARGMSVEKRRKSFEKT